MIISILAFGLSLADMTVTVAIHVSYARGGDEHNIVGLIVSDLGKP